jgi:hypothetical protein
MKQVNRLIIIAKFISEPCECLESVKESKLGLKCGRCFMVEDLTNNWPEEVKAVCESLGE